MTREGPAAKFALPYSAVLMAFAIFSVGNAHSAVNDESITDIDKKIIVDCFLGRGTVRKTGGAVSVRPSPGQHRQISKLECDSRGGESILYDAANPRTAIQLWSGLAEAGDKDASNRLCQIYEMGIGTEPDYDAAAKWYRRAVTAGSRAAALNLASLHDRGKGVPQDRSKAEQYYRMAAGAPSTQNTGSVEASTRKLQASQRHIDQLQVKAWVESGDTQVATEAELEVARKTLEKVLGTDASGNVSSVLLMEVGEEAGGRPTITLLDPNLVSTRGLDRVVVPDQVKVREIVGRVRAKNGVSSVHVNDTVAVTD